MFYGEVRPNARYICLYDALVNSVYHAPARETVSLPLAVSPTIACHIARKYVNIDCCRLRHVITERTIASTQTVAIHNVRIYS